MSSFWNVSVRGVKRFEWCVLGQTSLLLALVPACAGSSQAERAKAEPDAELLMMQAQALIKEGKAAEAGNLLERLAERDHLAPLQRFQLASLLGGAQRYKKAILLFNSLPPAFPDSFSRGYGLALAYFEDGQYAMSIKTLNALERLGPVHPEILSLLGLAYAKSGDTLKFHEAFERAISARPGDSRNYLAYAAVSVRHSQYTQAAQVLSSALDRISGEYKLYLARGSVYILLRELDKGQADCEKALALDPTDSRVYLALGLCHIGQTHNDQAAEVFRRAIRQPLKDKQLYYFLADVLLRKGVAPGSSLYDEALSAAGSCLAIDPKFAYCYLARARMELMAKRVAEAISDLERARSLHPNSRSILYHLAVAYQQAGKKAEAHALLASMKDLTIREFQLYRTMLLVDIINSLYVSPF